MYERLQAFNLTAIHCSARGYYCFRNCPIARST